MSRAGQLATLAYSLWFLIWGVVGTLWFASDLFESLFSATAEATIIATKVHNAPFASGTGPSQQFRSTVYANYTYQVSGTSYHGRADIGEVTYLSPRGPDIDARIEIESIASSYPVGSKHTAYYKKAQPGSSSLSSDIHPGSWLMLALCILFTLAGIGGVLGAFASWRKGSV